MAERLTLYGFAHSVYTRAVRIALIEMQMTAESVEVDPFAEPPDPKLAEITPFRRVPVLQHGSFVLTETSAILRYLDRIAARPGLTPDDPQAAARMAQVMAIVDADVYWPMVRGVYSHGAYRPLLGLPANAERVEMGLPDAKTPLAALEAIAQEGLVLRPDMPTLADCHLVPMISAFAQVAPAREMLAQHAALSRWWASWRERPSLLETTTAL